MIAVKNFIEELSEIHISQLSLWPGWFRWIVVSILCMTVLIVGLHGFIFPQLKTINHLVLNEQQLKGNFLGKKQQAETLAFHSNELLTVEKRLHNLLHYFSVESEVSLSLNNISRLGLLSGLDFNMIKLGDPIENNFYVLWPISITVSGQFHQLGRFVSDLTALPKIVTIDDFQIKRKSQTKQLQMSAQLYTYQYIENNNPR